MAFKDLSTENQGKVKILNAILEQRLEGLDYKNPEHRAEIMAVRSDVKNHEY
ncbi:hypothetical protein [Bacillus sp. Bos-x628]|uniref:hypothetical protein n=1 Tax=Bacillus maqinnsis TaxID=3229854 RepID=UPI00338FABD4